MKPKPPAHLHEAIVHPNGRVSNDRYDGFPGMSKDENFYTFLESRVEQRFENSAWSTLDGFATNKRQISGPLSLASVGYVLAKTGLTQIDKGEQNG